MVNRRGLFTSLDLRFRQNGKQSRDRGKEQNKQRAYSTHQHRNTQHVSSSPSKHINLPCRVQDHKQSFALCPNQVSSELALAAYHPPAAKPRDSAFSQRSSPCAPIGSSAGPYVHHASSPVIVDAERALSNPRAWQVIIRVVSDTAESEFERRPRQQPVW